MVFGLLGISSLASASSTPAEWSGGVDLKEVDFPVYSSPVVNNQLYQADLKLGVVKQTGNVKWTGKVEYVGDPGNNSVEEQSYVDLPEFNLKWKKDPLLFKVGTDIYSWGVTDVINPVDLVNTKNYFDPIHSRKMGAGSVSVNYAGSWFEMDAVFIPQARPAQMPGGNSRWLPRQVYISQNAGGQGVELLIPNQFSYSYLPRQTLGTWALQNNAALRLQAHLDSMELALYGYDGVASTPIIIPVVSGMLNYAYPLQIIQVNSNVQLLLKDYRQQTGGASATKTLGSWQLKGEAAWTQASQDAAAYQGWSLSTVMAVEKSWDIASAVSLTTILQYASSRRQVLSGNDLSSFGDFFNSNWMLGGHLSWHDNDTITFFYSLDVLTQSWLADVSYERRLSDSWKISAGGTSLDGPSTSPLGIYASNKSLYVDLGWSY